MDSTPHSSHRESHEYNTEAIDPNPQYGNITQIQSLPPVSNSSHFGPSNLAGHPSFFMNTSFPSHALSPYGYGFPFQDLLHSSSIPFENPVPKTSKGPQKGDKGKQKTSTSQTAGSNKNWTKDEEVALTEAWLYVSVDADVGNNQKISNMWNRIAQIWREKMETYDESRTTNSLQCHWCKILAAVNKFHALFERLLRNPKSGASQEDMRREAMRMFEDINDGQSFKYEHCWEIMKTNPKWCTKEVTKVKELSKQRAASDTNVDTKVPSTIPLIDANKEQDDINIDAPSAINGSDVERPQGRKGTKEKKRRLNEEKGVVDVLSKMQTILEKQISVSEEELKMKREKDIKDFDLKEKIMKKEVEFKENAHKLKANAQKLKEKDQQLKENDQKLKEKAQKRQDQERILNQDVNKLPLGMRETFEKYKCQVIKEWENDGLFGHGTI